MDKMFVGVMQGLDGVYQGFIIIIGVGDIPQGVICRLKMLHHCYLSNGECICKLNIHVNIHTHIHFTSMHYKLEPIDTYNTARKLTHTQTDRHKDRQTDRQTDKRQLVLKRCGTRIKKRRKRKTRQKKTILRKTTTI